MQKDMHYYGTYAMAIAAGFPQNDAAVVAYAAQFVDDSTRYDSGKHKDGGLLFGITTAHHPSQSLIRCADDHKAGLEEQRRIWIPFHFFPGGVGDTFQEKLLCVKDGPIIRECLENYLINGIGKPYHLELLGIYAHVYADTFSHYGFSGISSEYNRVKGNTLKVISHFQPAIDECFTKTIERLAENIIGQGAEELTQGLGHASVTTQPDCPYLHWTFEFEKKRPGNGAISNRDNVNTYLEACEKLHAFFMRCAKAIYAESTSIDFPAIRDRVHSILQFEGDEQERSKQWINSGLVPSIPHYDPTIWESQKKSFTEFKDSTSGIDTHIYRFHQAAAFHRYYALKDLLPSHGIAVY